MRNLPVVNNSNHTAVAGTDSAESIKDKILSRISKIEERRKASNANEGIRSFNLDISSIQESVPKNYESIKSHNKFLPNRKIGEENLSDNEESTHMTYEKPMSTKPSSDHYSAQNIAHSSVPRRNLTTYNSTLPDQPNGVQDIKESQVISHRVCTRDSHVSNSDNVIVPIPVPMKAETKQPPPQNEAQQQQQGFELVTACYEYKAQKVMKI